MTGEIWITRQEIIDAIEGWSGSLEEPDKSTELWVANWVQEELKKRINSASTIKTDNTKVILHLESELKEAVELIEKGKFLYESLAEAGQISITDPKKITESINAFNAFLTKHKSKE